MLSPTTIEGVSPVFAIPFVSDSLFFGVLMIPLGVYLGYIGLRKFQMSQLVANTPTQKARSLAGGRAELEGEAEPADALVPKPISDGDCVYAQYEVQERRMIRIPTGGKRRDVHLPVWVTVGRGDIGERFYLEDDTGRVPIETTDLDLQVGDENTTTTVVASDERKPDAVQAFEADHDVEGTDKGFIERTKEAFHPTNIGVRTLLRYYAIMSSPLFNIFLELGLMSRRRRRYVEKIVDPGEDLYVFGYAREQADKAADAIDIEDRLIMTKDEMTDRFVASDAGTEDRTASRLKRQAPLWVLGGGLMSLAGLYFLVTGLL